MFLEHVVVSSKARYPNCPAGSDETARNSRFPPYLGEFSPQKNGIQTEQTEIRAEIWTEFGQNQNGIGKTKKGKM